MRFEISFPSLTFLQHKKDKKDPAARDPAGLLAAGGPAGLLAAGGPAAFLADVPDPSFVIFVLASDPKLTHKQA